MAEQIELLTAKETWRALKLCERTLRDLTNSGELPCVRIGKALRYDPADVRAFIERKKQPRLASVLSTQVNSELAIGA
jgi:hypothetical protein